MINHCIYENDPNQILTNNHGNKRRTNAVQDILQEMHFRRKL